MTRLAGILNAKYTNKIMDLKEKHIQCSVFPLYPARYFLERFLWHGTWILPFKSHIIKFYNILYFCYHWQKFLVAKIVSMLLLWSLNHILLKSYPFSSADTSSRQPRLTAWLCLGVSKTSTSSRHLRLLYSSGRVALGKTQVGADLGLHHSGNPRASIPSRQLQTMSEHHHLAPTQLILHGWQRLVVSGHSQSLELTGLGKSLPLTCQQQPRLNYKRRVHGAHTKGTPWVPTLGNRGGCATRPYRTPTTLGNTTKTWSQSSST